MDAPKTTVLEERTYDTKGTTKLNIWDDGFDQSGTEYEFKGNISSAPIGKMRIRKVHYEYPDGLEFDSFNIDIVQSGEKHGDLLDLYLDDRYYSSMVKKQCELNCETAAFDIETKFGYDHFHTGADGDYGVIIQMKQYYGMLLKFWLDTDLFEMDELEERFLALFPKRKMS